MAGFLKIRTNNSLTTFTPSPSHIFLATMRTRLYARKRKKKSLSFNAPNQTSLAKTFSRIDNQKDTPWGFSKHQKRRLLIIIKAFLIKSLTNFH